VVEYRHPRLDTAGHGRAVGDRQNPRRKPGFELKGQTGVEGVEAAQVDAKELIEFERSTVDRTHIAAVGRQELFALEPQGRPHLVPGRVDPRELRLDLAGGSSLDGKQVVDQAFGGAQPPVDLFVERRAQGTEPGAVEQAPHLVDPKAVVTAEQLVGSLPGEHDGESVLRRGAGKQGEGQRQWELKWELHVPENFGVVRGGFGTAHNRVVHGAQLARHAGRKLSFVVLRGAEPD
jgi:hypothetical protein